MTCWLNTVASNFTSRFFLSCSNQQLTTSSQNRFFPLPSSIKSLKIGKFSTTNRFEIEAKGSPIPAKSVANWARRMICKFQVHIETQKPLQQYPFGARQQESIWSNRKCAKFAFPKIAFTHSCWAAGRLNLDESWISRF